MAFFPKLLKNLLHLPSHKTRFFASQVIEIRESPQALLSAARGSDVIKRLLSNLGTIGNGLAELRGLYGTGHGKHGTATGLSARHARLAVGAASTLIVFLFATHTETKAR